MVGGIGFFTTSAISGFLVAWGGMAGTLIFAIGLSLVVIAHLLFIQVDEPRDAEDHAEPRRIDLAGTFRIVLAIPRSEEHTSELQSLMRISYAVFCLKKKTKQNHL